MADGRSRAPYVWSGGIALLAFAATLLLPVDQWIKNLIALPFVIALTTALIPVWRDWLSDERKRRLQESQNDFAVATASHMATVAYDRHVAFCEAYMARVNTGMRQLFREGPRSEEVLQFAYDLADIRAEHAVWLTEQVDTQLAQFERTLRGIGADDRLLEHLEVGDARNAVVRRLYDAFGKVVEIGKVVKTDEAGEQEEQTQSRSQVLSLLRSILGTEELTALRMTATELAASRACNTET